MSDGMGSQTEVTREVSAALIHPGPGYVARARDVVIWAEPEPGQEGTEALDTLISGLRDIGDQFLPGDQASVQVSMLLTDARVSMLAGLAAVLPTASGLVAVARGWGEVSGGDSSVGASPDEPTIRIIELIDETLVVGRRDITEQVVAGPPPPTPPPGANDQTAPSVCGLVDGVVPGGAAVLGTRITIVGFAKERVRVEAFRDWRPSGPQVDDSARAHSTRPADAEVESEVVPLDGPLAPPLSLRSPLPMASARSNDAPPGSPPDPGHAGNGSGVHIEGIECMRGHLNNPISLHCGSCGISLIKRSSARVQGIRPALGVLVFDDGSTFAVKDNFVLGAAPDVADAVLAGEAQGLRLVDPSDEIEALHAEVRLQEWDVTLIDWSTRGTYVLPEDADSWQLAQRGVPTTLIPGTHVAIGRRTLVFDTASRPLN